MQCFWQKSVKIALSAFLVLAACPAAAQSGEEIIPAAGRFKITYEGDLQGVLIVKDRSRNVNVRVGPLGVTKDGTRQISVSARYQAEVTYEGELVTGFERQTSASPILNGYFPFRGVRRGEFCDIENDRGERFTVHCTLERFAYDQLSTGPQGQTLQAQIRSTKSDVIDLVEHERIEALQRAEAERAAARPKPPQGQLAEAVERVIIADSASWTFRVYKPGSVRDVEIKTGDDRDLKIVSATYSYQDGSSTWINVVVRKGGGVQCIEYGDEIFTGCRAVGDNPALAVIGAALSSADVSDGGKTWQQDTQEAAERQARLRAGACRQYGDC